MIFKRSLIAELANLAGAVFTVLFTIVLAVAMVRFLNMAAGGSIEHGTVVQLVLYNALVNLPPLLAASLFIATLMTLMRSWQDNEMVVWFSSGGRSILSWIEPTVKFALPIVVVIALLSIVISPWARAETDRLRNSVSAREDVNAIAPGRFIEAMGGKRVFFVESAEEGGNEVDGGVKPANIARIAAAGADTFVAGSAVFGAGSAQGYAEVIRSMKSAVAVLA